MAEQIRLKTFKTDMTISELEISGKKLTCSVQYKRIRHAYLRITPDMHLKISLPQNRRITAESILKDKLRWLEKKVKELSCVKKLFSNGKMLYQGEYLKVEFRLAEAEFTGVKLDKKSVIVYGNSEKNNHKLLIEFVTQQTFNYVREKAKEFAPRLGVCFQDIATKQIKSWGYCTRQGKLSFNWRLICLPVSLIDFIVYHELLHLRHFDHSKRFKNAMEKQFENYKELQAALKTFVVN
jgi:predicted metal-dependent hydrolase